MKKKKIYKNFIKYIIATIIIIISYIFFDVQQVPQALYETQIMKPEQNEAYYVNQWCSSDFGRKEFVLLDNTRIDCLTKDYAIEFDFAKKWAESVGQSLYYSQMTNKKPAVVLILTKQEDEKYVKRVEKTSSNIKIFLIKTFSS